MSKNRKSDTDFRFLTQQSTRSSHRNWLWEKKGENMAANFFLTTFGSRYKVRWKMFSDPVFLPQAAHALRIDAVSFVTASYGPQ